jgi:hypothetical protein
MMVRDLNATAGTSGAGVEMITKNTAAASFFIARHKDSGDYARDQRRPHGMACHT